MEGAYEPLAAVVGALKRRGATAVVLGCTEIPLGVQAGPWQTLNIPIIDTIDALARAAIAWARPNSAPLREREGPGVGPAPQASTPP